ncbi:MAG: DNA gyrase/topoisomerase IV subunit A [Prevotellaceae bacterium]|nr:DNA gyrase/topoisomerase IV subunit A [Prevotellaceae bacterium]
MAVAGRETLNHLSGMYRNWFLDYASYVNLERAIPHINDGLKPVQRRVLHAMKRMEDGRYNKVASIVGNTMHFHPHGDASIYEALVNLGQKNLLIDCQGNWGNILTGDGAAAPRYIEARLSKFAVEAVFNPKTTIWKPSYDGRNEEPVSLPVKFPLLLVQGSEGIGLGLNSRILPHNFNEVARAAIACLKGEAFELLPDFPTSGLVDASRYNDGERGGRVKIRARIEKSPDNRRLIITEIPYGTTTGKLIETILKANERGKINIKKVDDNTAEKVEIVVHLEAKTSSDKTIDALYAFTACEISYSPNCCVVDNEKPQFITVSDVLRRNTETAKVLLQRELEILRGELIEQLLFASLEKIFISERIYKDKAFENAVSTDAALNHIDSRIEPFKKDFVREIVRDDLLRLLDIKMARILKFNTDKSEENIVGLQAKIAETDHQIAHIVDYAIKWFEHLIKTYGHLYPRLTEIRSFETILATKVAEANEKLYINRADGFIGTALKKDEQEEFVSNCSDIDDIIIFFKDGKYKVVKVADKLFVGKDVEHLAVFLKNDRRTIYNVAYRDGRNGPYYMKRFAVNGVTRDKEYDLTQGKEGSRIVYFSANPNGEAETVKIQLRPTTRRIKKIAWDVEFSAIAIKGRQSRGNLLTKFTIQKISLKQKGGSTLGGSHIWFDRDVLRLNTDQRGDYLGEFFTDDQLLVITKSGEYYTKSFDLNNHFEDDILRIEKFDVNKIWSIALYDAEQGYHYIKRFPFEQTQKRSSFLGASTLSRLLLISDVCYPRFEVRFGGKDAHREPVIIDVETFIGVKSLKAKGKRISTFTVERVDELEPLRFPEQTDAPISDSLDSLDSLDDPDSPETPSSDNSDSDFDAPVQPTLVYDKDNLKPDIDEPSGQMSLF